MGFKKTGFGKGKLNGFGGKVKENESIGEAAIRELHEEARVKTTLEDIVKVGEISFFFPYVPKKGWDQRVHVFFARRWEGEPKESKEMKPLWINVNELPFERMWQDDRHWLPLLLNNKKVKGSFVFKEDNESIEHFEMEEVGSDF